MTQHISLLISDEMAAEIDLIAKDEHATRGEVVRDAIRQELERRVMARTEQPAPLRVAS